MAAGPVLPGLSSVRSLLAGLLDIVYPPCCLVCERYDSPPLCDDCAGVFTALPEPVCEFCGRPVEDGTLAPCRTCEAHREATSEPWAFEAARAAAIFEGPLRQAVMRLKYTHGESLGLPLGAFLANRVVVDELFSPSRLAAFTAVVAVPMHPARQRGRGFNQARLLAEPVAELLGIPLTPPGTVRRVRRRPPQVGLSSDARRRNLLKVFSVRPQDASALAGQNLLLIDDVFTTGSTVNACAAELRRAGAASVFVATLAGGG